MVGTVLNEFLKKTKRLVKLTRLHLWISDRSAARHHEQGRRLFVRNDVANILRDAGIFAQRVKIQQRIVVVASIAQPLEKLDIGLFSISSRYGESSHRQGNHH